jgi:hypothetical protein
MFTLGLFEKVDSSLWVSVRWGKCELFMWLNGAGKWEFFVVRFVGVERCDGVSEGLRECSSSIVVMWGISEGGKRRGGWVVGV